MRVDARALVLGGGGVSGIAWETGFLVGLVESGALDPTAVNTIIGTSAGATVAAQITSGVGMDTLLSLQLDTQSDIEPKPHVDIRTVLDEIDYLLNSTPDPVEGRRRVGTFALDADVPTLERRMTIVANRLPIHRWPESNLIFTAVDAESGALVELTERSGLPLVDAVAASCAIPGVWPPVPWNGRYLIDGGMRTVANADLAAGFARVLVLQPFEQKPRPSDSADVDPSSTLVIRPDESYREAAPNALDPAARPVSATLGRDHARRVAREVELFWHS
ncbi:patatin-like phospholipase family protein [Rhodococcus fascians]|nr:patatin-like phospholipase family protein [Rhodococcus fascians]MBY4114689.1 patatin-like phospholipase family protein [Rhodococcus fascians]